jgi:hypothetical protein
MGTALSAAQLPGSGTIGLEIDLKMQFTVFIGLHDYQHRRA